MTPCRPVECQDGLVRGAEFFAPQPRRTRLDDLRMRSASALYEAAPRLRPLAKKAKEGASIVCAKVVVLKLHRRSRRSLFPRATSTQASRPWRETTPMRPLLEFSPKKSFAFRARQGSGAPQRRRRPRRAPPDAVNQRSQVLPLGHFTLTRFVYFLQKAALTHSKGAERRAKMRWSTSRLGSVRGHLCRMDSRIKRFTRNSPSTPRLIPLKTKTKQRWLAEGSRRHHKLRGCRLGTGPQRLNKVHSLLRGL